MNKTIIFRVDVQFGDCDPAGIVFFPKFSRWMDAASHYYFPPCGLPPWRAMNRCAGLRRPAPAGNLYRFKTAATYGERIEIHTTVEEWRGKVFIQTHRVMRGDELICDGREPRALCVRDDRAAGSRRCPCPTSSGPPAPEP